MGCPHTHYPYKTTTYLYTLLHSVKKGNQPCAISMKSMDIHRIDKHTIVCGVCHFLGMSVCLVDTNVRATRQGAESTRAGFFRFARLIHKYRPFVLNSPLHLEPAQLLYFLMESWEQGRGRLAIPRARSTAAQQP